MILGVWTAALAADPVLEVCATTPDLGALARAVGGDRVAVTVFARGADDPHFAEPRPSHARALARARLLIETGLERESGWLPVLREQARNPAVAAGGAGAVVAAAAIVPLGAPQGHVDRSHGHVHAGGNPHFLLDPVQGWKVAKRLAARFAAADPAGAESYAARCGALARRLAAGLVGEDALGGHDGEAVLAGVEDGTVASVLGRAPAGWLGRLGPFAGRRVVADHDLWPYLARRYRLAVVGFLEPKPGVPPTTAHLAGLVETVRAQQVAAIIAVPYFDLRHARFLAERTGIPVAVLAHQPGALPGTDDYVDCCAQHVRALAQALAGAR
jgi:ABC-type Zn uptake system ZnuABC Zn-binding protein ZnuA